VLGHEWDEDIDNGFRPAGLIHLSETTVNNVSYLWDWGSVDDTGTATHTLTLYRARSGALVFGAGTVQWSWGLDAHHDSVNGMLGNYANRYDIRVGEDPRAPDVRVQQATVNLFGRHGSAAGHAHSWPGARDRVAGQVRPTVEDRVTARRIERRNRGDFDQRNSARQRRRRGGGCGGFD